MAGRKVYLVGAGPGDPELLTLRAWRILQRAEVVLYDRLVSAEVLACVNPRALLVDVGKHEGQQCEVQRQIVPLLIAYHAQYTTVVRLKSGDPMVFARGAEELEELAAAGVSVEVVPGISSSFAGPALAGIPLTYRGVARHFTIVTGHGRDGVLQDWRAIAGVDTLIILMGVKARVEIAQALRRAGRPAAEPCAFLERVSTPTERRVFATLGDVAAGRVEVEAPAVWVQGEVVALAASNGLCLGAQAAAALPGARLA